MRVISDFIAQPGFWCSCLYKLCNQKQGTRDLGNFGIVSGKLVKENCFAFLSYICFHKKKRSLLFLTCNIVSSHSFVREIRLQFLKMTSCFQVWNQSGLAQRKGNESHHFNWPTETKICMGSARELYKFITK